MEKNKNIEIRTTVDGLEHVVGTGIEYTQQVIPKKGEPSMIRLCKLHKELLNFNEEKGVKSRVVTKGKYDDKRGIMETIVNPINQNKMENKTELKGGE